MLGPEEHPHQRVGVLQSDVSQSLRGQSSRPYGRTRLTTGKESELGQVDLPDDDPKALALVLACLQGLPDRPVWYLLDFWLEVAVEALLSTHPSKDNWATIEEALEVYFIADKYGIQSIRDGLADWGLSALLEIHFEFRFGRAATVDDFLEHFFKPVRDRLGRFPRELHGHYINAINHFLHTKEDLEKLIKTTKDDPLLTASLVLPLAKNLAESREESRRLKRKLKRKSYQLATVSSYGRGVAIREAADCGLCWNDLNDELNQKDSKVWDDCDGDDYMEYSDMSDS